MLPASEIFTCGASLRSIHSAEHIYSSLSPQSDPRSAALFFMLAASPSHGSLQGNLDAIKAERLVCSSPIGNNHWCEEWLVWGVPDTIGSIKARKVYVQTPSKVSTEVTNLNLAWRLEVTMLNNQYEAYVSAYDSSKIISVVDWVADAPAPSEDGWLSALERGIFGPAAVGVSQMVEEMFLGASKEEPPTSASYLASGSYRVWKWGVNDPESGNRTLEVPSYDTVASPLGWHAVPASADPLTNHPENEADTIVKYTSTIGNNVSMLSYPSGRNVNLGICAGYRSVQLGWRRRLEG